MLSQCCYLYVYISPIYTLFLVGRVLRYDYLKFEIINKENETKKQVEGTKVKNYKQTIIKAFNKAIEERGMKESIIQTPKKARWVNKRKYWTNLITVSMDKWKTEYWIDLSICFRWEENMEYVSLGWSILGNDHGLDRFCIEISEETTEEKIQEVANEIIDKYIKHNEINTPENLNKRIHIYDGKEIIPEGNFWEDFNKFVLNYIVGDYEKGKEYYNKAKAMAWEMESSLGTIKPFLDIVDNPELVLKKIEEICEKNIDKV